MNQSAVLAALSGFGARRGRLREHNLMVRAKVKGFITKQHLDILSNCSK